MDVTGILLATIIIILAIAYYVHHHFGKTRKMLYYAAKLDGPRGLPLIGSAFYLLGSNTTVAKNIIYLAKKFKSPWKLWLGTGLYVVVTRPEDVEIVLNQALSKARNYKFTKPILEEGLFTAPVEKWKRHKKVISSTFSMPILNNFVKVFSAHSLKLVERLEEFAGKDKFDVFPFMNKSAVEITCETAMGKNINENSKNFDYGQCLTKAMTLVFTRLFQLWMYPSFIWNLTSHSVILKKLSKDLHDFVAKIVSDKQIEYRLHQDEYCEESVKRKCFLDHLIELSETSEHWPDHELMEEAQTMVAAGSESMGSTLSFVLMMVGMHPEVQEKVYEEIDSVFGQSRRDISCEDLPRLVYLERVVKETLRLFPVAACLGRLLDKDIVTSNYTLPKGCECLIPIMYIHRDPNIWEHPSEFNPDRFLPEEVSKRHPYSYLPFSGGPRSCIGFKYAMMAMKTAICTVLRHYKVSTELKSLTDVDFVPGVVLKPSRGYRIGLQRRDFGVWKN